MDYKNFSSDGITFDHLFLLIVMLEAEKESPQYREGIDQVDLFKLTFMVAHKLRNSSKEFFNFPFFTTVVETQEYKLKDVFHNSLNKIFQNALDQEYLSLNLFDVVNITPKGKNVIQQSRDKKVCLKNQHQISFFTDSFYQEIVSLVKHFLGFQPGDLLFSVRKIVNLHKGPQGVHFHQLELV